MTLPTILKQGAAYCTSVFDHGRMPKPNPEMLPEQVTVYSALLDNTIYSRESFELSERFFREMVGLDLRFQFCGRDEVPTDSLDHRTRLAIVEVDEEGVKELVERQVQSKLAPLYEGLELLRQVTLESPSASNIRQIRHIESEINSFSIAERSFIAQEYHYVGGQACPEESTVYVTNTENIRSTIAFNNLRGMYEELELLSQVTLESPSYLKPQDKEIKTGYSPKTRDAAMTIVHELGHLAGLWHTFMFSNDGFRDHVGKTPNLMSYEPVSDAEYGFIITRKQQEHLRDFFRGGEQFRLLQEHNFDFGAYLTAVAAANGYRFKK